MSTQFRSRSTQSGSLQIQIVLILAACIAGFAAGVKWHVGQDAIRESRRLEELNRQILMRHERQNKASAGHEADKERIRVQYITITKEVERIVEKPFYRDACLDDDGLRVLRSAITE